MCSLSRKRPMRELRLALVAVPLVAGWASGTAHAASDGYFTPEIELHAQHHTNPEMVSAKEKSATGYLANARGVFGWRSLTSLTEFRPKIEYNSYSSRKDLRHINQYADLQSRFTSLRAEWNLVANYARESSYSAQQTSAVYDEFDPDDPTVDATGDISLISETRTRVQARPSFSYRFSDRLGTELSAFYQSVSGEADSTGSIVDYRDTSASAALFWSLSPQSQLAAGVYSAKYKTDDGSNETTGKGVSFELNQKWSETFSSRWALNLERTKVDQTGLLADDTGNSWGAEYSLRRVFVLGDIRLSLGRIFSPSSGGTRATVDQARVQYYRNFKPRWSYLVAVRGIRNRDQGVGIGRYNRDYLTGNLQLNWEMTQTWYLTGGYSHYWQKYVVSGAKSQNNVLSLGIGYRGLGPQNR
jgi:hypothetical protein